MKIVFQQSDRLFAKLIRWFTKSQWSHCFIALDDDLEGEALCFESSAVGGVKLSLYSTKGGKRAVFSINRPTSIRYLYPYLGKNYGYFQILGYPLARLFGLKNNPIKKDYVCSEIVLRFLIENNFTEFMDLDPNSVSPGDLYRIISNNAVDFTLEKMVL